MTGRLTRAVTTLSLLALGAGGALAWQGTNAEAQDDSRQPITVPAMMREHMLAEMRGLLTAVNGVLHGVAANDTALMRRSAAAAGMAGMGMGPGRGMGMGARVGAPPAPAAAAEHAHGAPPVEAMPGMSRMLPPAFHALGQATHLGFDSLATAIAAGATRDTVVARLAALTTNCVSCHRSYRLVTP